MSKQTYSDAHAAVRFFGLVLDPIVATHALLLPPDFTYRPGEPRVRRSAKGIAKHYGFYKGGMWTMSSKQWVKSTRLAIHLEWLLDQLEPQAGAIETLQSQEIGVDFFCLSMGQTATKPALPRILRHRAAKLRITIEIDHYDLRS